MALISPLIPAEVLIQLPHSCLYPIEAALLTKNFHGLKERRGGGPAGEGYSEQAKETAESCVEKSSHPNKQVVI